MKNKMQRTGIQTTIPFEFETYLQNKTLENSHTDLNEIIFAKLDLIDLSKPIDRNQGLPPKDKWVHVSPLASIGKSGENAVVYSAIVGGDIPEFEFNAIYLHDKNTPNSCGMIIFQRDEIKQSGMTITKSCIMQFSGAAESANVFVDAETWQVDISDLFAACSKVGHTHTLDEVGGSNPNLFINGDFSVWQRPYPNVIGGYCADRWQLRGAAQVGGSMSVSTAIGSSRFPYRYLMIQTTGATSLTYFEQKIKVDSPLEWSGDYTISFRTDNSYSLPDSRLNVCWREIVSGADASTVLSVPMPLLNGVQKNVKTITLPKIENFSTSKKYMLVVQISSGSAPHDGKQRIAEMKFERGGTATPFVVDDEAVNFAKCQRYYEVVDFARCFVGADISGQLAVFSEFSVAKHSAPSVSIKSFTQFIPTIPSGEKRDSLNLVSSNPSLNSLQLLITGTPAFPAFQAGLIYMTIIADAEI